MMDETGAPPGKRKKLISHGGLYVVRQCTPKYRSKHWDTDSIVTTLSFAIIWRILSNYLVSNQA